MKKLICLLLCLSLTLSACTGLASRSSDTDAEQASYTATPDPNTDRFDIYACRVGHIYFTMNSLPDEVAHDVDLVRTDATASIPIPIGWSGKTQFAYYDDTGEWHYHVADISGTIQEVRDEDPDMSEDRILGNALYAFAYMSLLITGANMSQSQPKLKALT